MKTKYWVIIFALIFCLCGILSFSLFRDNSASSAQILSGGNVIRTVNLNVPQSFTVESSNGGSNTITVESGRIAVTQATCPDGYCMQRGFCSGGAQIVCLPNKLVIRFLGEQEIDAVVG